MQGESIRRAAATVAAAAYGALAVTLLWKGVGEGHYDRPSEYVVGWLFVVALVGVAVAVGLFDRASTWGVRLVVVGSLLVALGTAYGNVTGEDPDWFVVFGGPGNLLAFLGCILIARALWPRGGAPRVLAVLLVLYVPASLVLAEIGGGFVAAVTWLLVAARYGVAPSAAPGRAAMGDAVAR